jgi:ferredoxin-NADP reductase
MVHVSSTVPLRRTWHLVCSAHCGQETMVPLKGRLTWKVCTVVALHDETATARTIALQVPEWPGHVAGQRVALRVTAADGYSAVREYSIASAPREDGRIELSVERLPDGEVSPYLTQELAVGDFVELRGPIGGWFVWREDQAEAIQLIAGGSGIVPLMAMIRSRVATPSATPFRLLYSVRHPEGVWYRDELQGISADGIGVTFIYTRTSPPSWPRPPGRIDATLLAEASWPSTLSPTCYVCGPTSFVEHVAQLLTTSGHHPDRVRTERFGPTGTKKEDART